ncbi:ATP-binding cassette domain-containing protein [soil metagenome]
MDFSSAPVVALNDVAISQEVHTVLSHVTFEVQKGEFVYLVGRTGSGKSSLLKTLYADLPLYAGTAYVADFPVHKLSRSKVPYLRRKVGIVFQDFQLLSDRTVADNMRFVLRATGWSDRSKIKNRIAEVLMRVGLDAAAPKMPHQLSGGEQQRVVIARALLNEPVILFADEPTGNLDPDVADEIMQLFLQINNSGTAIMMATHNHQLISAYPQRVLKCEAGRVLDSAKQTFSLGDGF